MLVLSRRKTESIMVGEDVEITVVGVYGNKIRLGITAPKSIPVHRKEVFDAIHSKKITHRNNYLLVY
jgi:carbon storage regulator